MFKLDNIRPINLVHQFPVNFPIYSESNWIYIMLYIGYILSSQDIRFFKNIECNKYIAKVLDIQKKKYKTFRTKSKIEKIEKLK